MRFLCLLLLIATSCKTTTYYISRHAEKAGTMSSDPQLTAEGEKQAMDLQNYLKSKNIAAIYSTNYIRTKATAAPTAQYFGLSTMVYSPAGANALIDSLKTANKRNILLVGHSNTVDDMVNRFTGMTSVIDLPESEYGSLFIVKKKGSHYTVEKITVPKTASR